MADLNSSIPPETVFDLSTIYHDGPAPPTQPECTTPIFDYTPAPIFDTQFGENVNNVQPTGRPKVATPKRRAKKPTPAPKKPTPTPKKKISVELMEKTQTKPKRKGSSSGAFKRKRATESELPEETLNDSPMLYDSEDDVTILDEDVDENAGVNDGVGVDVGGGGGNNQTGVNNWAEIDPDNLNAEEGYYSTNTSLDGDEGPTQEDINKVDVEFVNFAQETENIFTNEENDVNIGNPHQLVEDLVPEMEWPTIHIARAYIRRSTRPVDVIELILVKFGLDISYYTTWNAWTICMEVILGSFDDGYVVQPELCRQILSLNPGSLAKSSNDVETYMWMGTCVAYKASFDGFVNGSRPILGMDGCILKGKYGGVCLSIIGLDANNGLSPIAVPFFLPIDDFLCPPLPRESGRPRKVRIPDPDEALGPQKKYGIGIDLFGEGSTRGGTRGSRGRATRGVIRNGARGGVNRVSNIGGNTGPSTNRGGTTRGGATINFNPQAPA
ncbi:hypothetical protein GIB67_006635 [Kingdonia uniflora]|uniref:Uncharacterized protein n=1 Tax=Kingdonia uniflora TaxID=39325 RepID=A0A7J7LEC4_9MAGN|nr:hypothetical protein GIB67_006635 [Kingdonia uniflora]